MVTASGNFWGHLSFNGKEIFFCSSLEPEVCIRSKIKSRCLTLHEISYARTVAGRGKRRQRGRQLSQKKENATTSMGGTLAYMLRYICPP